MKNNFSTLSTAAIVIIANIVALPASAQTAPTSATLSISCPTTRSSVQALVNQLAPGTIGTINVTGTCTENVIIPRAKTVTIRTNPSALTPAKIRAADNSRPVITSNGETTIERMIIENSSGTADALVMAARSGYLSVVGSTLETTANVIAVVGIWDGSSGQILNSIVKGGDTAVEVWQGGRLAIIGQGSQTIISSPNGWAAVNCGIGSSLMIKSSKSGNMSGSILINDSNNGVAAEECSAQIKDYTGNAANLKITTTKSSAISLSKSSLILSGATIAENGGFGLNSQMSNAQIDRSIFSNNTKSDIGSGYASTIHFPSWWNTKSDIPDAFSASELQCWPTGEGKIFLDAAAIAIPPTKTLTDLTTNNQCIGVN